MQLRLLRASHDNGNLLSENMSTWWYILVGCSFIIHVLSQGNGYDCHHGDNCKEGPGDPGGGNPPAASQFSPQSPQSAGESNYDDCMPWQSHTSAGCKNCSEVGDGCSDHMKCCDGLSCSSDGFCSCNDNSKDCRHQDEADDNDDDDDGGDDNTLLEAAKIALAVALVIAAVAACVLVWRTCSKRYRRRNANSRLQTGRRSRQRSSMTSIQRYVLARLCNRPPRYEDNTYIQEEKPPPYEIAVATIGSSIATAAMLANTAPFKSPHMENAGYVEDETENSRPVTYEAGLHLCPACRYHCTGAANHTTVPETATPIQVSPALHSAHDIPDTCRTAQSVPTLTHCKTKAKNYCSLRPERRDGEASVSLDANEELKHVTSELHM